MSKCSPTGPCRPDSRLSRVQQLLFTAAVLTPLLAIAQAPGLLFQLSGDHGLTADLAQGDPEPNFAEKVVIQQEATHGPYIEASGEQVLSWNAPGNIYAQRGTLSFYWRARDPIGPTAFPLFRVGYADHSSWDMVWLRIDWNGNGFDAFVTDNNLARVRVSYATPVVPRADQWLLVTFTWDEAQGVALYIDGQPVASKSQVAVLDAGLDQFGPHSRIISSHQVQSAYQFIRGGDVDDIRVYDHALKANAVAALAAGSAIADENPATDFANAKTRQQWRHRYGWDTARSPPYLTDQTTVIRKVEFTDVYDLKQRMTAGSDGIAETTWPGVYNRSRIAGRHDYFELPDWNTYVEGGRSVTFELPDERWNRIEFRGAAFGTLTATDVPRAAIKRAKGEL